MGMGRLFHHWGARVEKLRSRDERETVIRLAGWARRPVAAEPEWSSWCVGLNDVL